MQKGKTTKIAGPVGEPSIAVISRSQVPRTHLRGRVAFVSQLPFWLELTERLRQGLGRGEALDITLAPTKKPDGEIVQPDQLISQIRHQFHKRGFSKKYSLASDLESKHLYVVDHETSALTDRVA